jgi:hypothetical protein
MEQSLTTTLGYSAAIPFFWPSFQPSDSALPQAGADLETEIAAVVFGLAAGADDVIDLHLIGHSRGAVVISKAMQDLLASAAWAPDSPLSRGYVKMTLLDPHPANNDYGLNASINPLAAVAGLPLAGYLGFQAAVHDPPVVVPARVNEAELYYQQNSFWSSPGKEFLVNLQGLGVDGITVQDPVATAFSPQILDQPGIGHSEVHEWYQAVKINGGKYVPLQSVPNEILNVTQDLLDSFLDVFDPLLPSYTPLQPPSGLSVPIDIEADLAPGVQVNEANFVVPAGIRLTINGGVWHGGSPALTLGSGDLTITGATFVNDTDAPTILVTGGRLTLRNDIIQESTGYSQAAISVTGGSVDLGTATDPGGNTININGAGAFIRNTTPSPVVAVGDTFEVDGQVTVWPIPLTVNTRSSLILAGNSLPPLTGSVNGTPFTGSIAYTTAYGDTVTVTLSTTATAGSPAGQYAVTATLSGADAADFVIDPATSMMGTMYVVSVGADPSSSTGAQPVTFWDNKGNAKLITAADLSSLDALNLVSKGGSAFDPRSVAQLQAWLSTSPNATTAYRLGVQLATMDLNVLAGNVQATDLVYAGGLLPYSSAYGITGLTSGGFIDVRDLMNAANAVLAQVNPGAPSGDPNRTYEAALAQVLQSADGNTDFVQQDLIWNLIGL